MKLLPVSQQHGLDRTLVYGRAGSGKTTFATSGHADPRFGQTLVINIDDGLRSVAHTTALATPRITSSAEFEEAIKCVKSKQEGFEKIKTVVVDDLSRLHKLFLDEAVINAKGNRDVDDIQLQDYNMAGKKLRRCIQLVLTLPCHVVLTALLKEVKDDQEKPVSRYAPDMFGQMPNTVMGMVDNVWCLMMQGPTPETDGKPAKPGGVAMCTMPYDLVQAKTRDPKLRKALGLVVYNPTMMSIADALLPAKKEETK